MLFVLFLMFRRASGMGEKCGFESVCGVTPMARSGEQLELDLMGNGILFLLLEEKKI